MAGAKAKNSRYFAEREEGGDDPGLRERTVSLLIDGYNLLHVTGLAGRGGRGSLERSRSALLSLLAHVLSDEERTATTVVFDAAEAPRGLPDQYVVQEMRVYYARHHASADDLLEELIIAHHTPKRLTVVSSDHRVQRAAKRRKATAVDSDVWYVEIHRRVQQHQQRRLTADIKPDTVPSTAEVQAWLKVFGVDKPTKAERPQVATESPPVKKKGAKRASTKPKAKAAVKLPKPTSRQESPRKKKPLVPRKPRARGKPRDLGFGSIENPFPPGYGEDVIEE